MYTTLEADKIKDELIETLLSILLTCHIDIEMLIEIMSNNNVSSEVIDLLKKDLIETCK